MSYYPMHCAPRCGAHARTTGQPCQAPAIKGKARCRMHGGKSPGRPMIHGRFSKAYKAERNKWRQAVLDLREIIKAMTSTATPAKPGGLPG